MTERETGLAILRILAQHGVIGEAADRGPAWVGEVRRLLLPPTPIGTSTLVRIAGNIASGMVGSWAHLPNPIVDGDLEVVADLSVKLARLIVRRCQ